jgi:phenol hydroxylase P5 protein
VESDVVIEVEVEEDEDARSIPIEDFSATVVRVEDLTPTTKGIWLAVEGDGVDFQAGQYINLKVPGHQQPRAFSIASSPATPNDIELHIRIVEGGAATTWLHSDLTVGDKLSFTAPLGRFFVRKSASEPIIFIAGGSGLSSPKSMILDLLESGDERTITLLYGARSVDEIYYGELFHELAETHQNFHYHVAISDGRDDDGWSGARGYVHELAQAVFDNKFGGHKAYLCGPPPMIDKAITTLMQGRLFEDHIFTENFFTAADVEEPARRSALFKKF